MRGDHRLVLAAMDEAEKMLPRTQSDAVRAQLATQMTLLEQQFATHMEAEDRVLIPALSALLPEARAALDELTEEHAALRALRADLSAALSAPDPGSAERAAVQLRDLIDLLRIHIRKEEAVVFHVAEQILTPAQRAEIATLLSRAPGFGTETSTKG
jgi:hemerythrin-like domain-containing protein